jgi:hypothetical protein
MDTPVISLIVSAVIGYALRHFNPLALHAPSAAQVDPVVAEIVALFKEWKATKAAQGQGAATAGVLKEIIQLAEQKVAAAPKG